MSEPGAVFRIALIGQETSKTEPQDYIPEWVLGAWKIDLTLCHRLSGLPTEEVDRALFTSSIAISARDEGALT